MFDMKKELAEKQEKLQKEITQSRQDMAEIKQEMTKSQLETKELERKLDLILELISKSENLSDD